MIKPHVALSNYSCRHHMKPHGGQEIEMESLSKFGDTRARMHACLLVLGFFVVRNIIIILPFVAIL